MKKNESLGYLAYLLMLVVAICVGMFVLRSDFSSTYASSISVSSYALVIIAIVVGIIVTAVFLEVGHIVGAKIGRYDVQRFVILGIGRKKKNNGKWVSYFGSFDGLTGETSVTPKDVKKSNPRPIIYMGLLFLFLEIVICVILLVIAMSSLNGGDSTLFWLKPASEVVMTIAGMVLIYDIFPAAIDSKNDGYLMTILNNKVNVEAYNQMLIAENNLARGIKSETNIVYDEVTDFTAAVNDVALYDCLDKGQFDDALKIVEKTLACQKKVSSSVYRVAEAQKIAIILDTKPLEEAKKYFIALPVETKKHIAALNSAPAIRAYLLANGLVEESIGETEAALNKVHDVYRKLPKEKKSVEKKLLKASVLKVLEAHNDWDLSDYGYKLEETKKEEPSSNVTSNDTVVTANKVETIDEKQLESETSKDASND